MKRLNKNLKEIINFLKENNLNKKNIDRVFSWDSKCIKSGQVFVSIKTKGSKKYNYINEAIHKGAIAVISDTQIKKSSLLKDLPILYSKYLKDKNDELLNYIYNFPLKKIKVIGITGTDGKTSQLNLLAQSLSLSGERVGVISSEGNGIYPKLDKTGYTTPRADILFNYFNKFRISKVNTILIECSSQGLEQGRLNNIKFNISILTNINGDHIDYHRSFKNYIKSKLILLNNTKEHIFINKDCFISMRNLKLITSRAKKHFYGISSNSHYKNKDLEITISNNYNISVISNILKLNKTSTKKSLNIISRLKTVKGRNQFIKTRNKGTYIVDYAHTPSSLLTLLQSVNLYSMFSEGKIITVFGCGGDRDIWKRRAMGEISFQFSNYVILTDDNPRSENPMKIINDIKKGIKEKKNLLIIPSRKSAIHKAISLAHKNDYIVIAGKGNEDDILYKHKIIKHNDIKVLKAKLK
ncbi:MAG: UDP-N-acetylmuramoyl-L-alanyl-D-glutamate--2,6-diaminopimelate ligase [Pseudomonadota bacterium]|nr:UDP-N-acetylmuramoyl-L-alanyl-D-glutamate--2,6-diaminopimelate ligase [Pseudomonadota bacterium]